MCFEKNVNKNIMLYEDELQILKKCHLKKKGKNAPLERISLNSGTGNKVAQYDSTTKESQHWAKQN